MSDHDLIVTGVGVLQLLVGLALGWIRWGRGCRRPRHEWVPNHFGFYSYEECARCGKTRPW